MKQVFRNFVVLLARLVGTTFRDGRTGNVLGRAFVIGWRGKVHFIGLEGGSKPVFFPQPRLTYWRQELGLETHESPNFSRIDLEDRVGSAGVNETAVHRPGASDDAPGHVVQRQNVQLPPAPGSSDSAGQGTEMLHVVLSHQPASAVHRMIEWWSRSVPSSNLLVASGANRAEFDAIDFAAKIYCGDDLKLKTKDHQRERQSYLGVFQAVAAWLRDRKEFKEIHFIEYDQVPLVPDLSRRLHDARREVTADVLGFQLLRVDGTNHPHCLYHLADPSFLPFLSKISQRSEKGVVLSMFGSGSVWSREAFEAVAATPVPVPIYLEIGLPTIAHHLGFRVVGFQDKATRNWVRNLGDYHDEIDKARAEGAWSLHPVKSLWTSEAPNR